MLTIFFHCNYIKKKTPPLMSIIIWSLPVQPRYLKGLLTQKLQVHHHLLILTFFQTCMTFSVFLKTQKEMLGMMTASSPSTFTFSVFGKTWTQSDWWLRSSSCLTSLFMFLGRQKLIRICKNMWVSKGWQNVLFGELFL